MNKSYDTNMEKIQIYIIIFSHSCLSPLLVEHNRRRISIEILRERYFWLLYSCLV
jgi:hypothetical protein